MLSNLFLFAFIMSVNPLALFCALTYVFLNHLSLFNKTGLQLNILVLLTFTDIVVMVRRTLKILRLTFCNTYISCFFRFTRFTIVPSDPPALSLSRLPADFPYNYVDAMGYYVRIICIIYVIILTTRFYFNYKIILLCFESSDCLLASLDLPCFLIVGVINYFFNFLFFS